MLAAKADVRQVSGVEPLAVVLVSGAQGGCSGIHPGLLMLFSNRNVMADQPPWSAVHMIQIMLTIASHRVQFICHTADNRSQVTGTTLHDA
jgi:hypothetical protein